MIIKHNREKITDDHGFLCIVDFTKVNKISVRGYYDAATFNSRRLSLIGNAKLIYDRPFHIR